MFRKIILVISESLLICLSGIAAIYIQFVRSGAALPSIGQLSLKFLVPMLVVQCSFYLFDLYDFALIRRRFLLALRIAEAIGLSALALALVFYLFPMLLVGRNVFFVQSLLMLTAMVWWRLFAMWLLSNPRLAERVLIVGTGHDAVDVARQVLARPQGGFEVVGFVGNDPELLGRSLLNPRVIGMVSDLEEVVRNARVNRIVIATGDQRGFLPLESLLELRLSDHVAIEESATFYERLTGRISATQLRPSQLLFATSSTWGRIYRRSHRIFDIVLASIGLLVASPLMLLAAIAIRLESVGPVFYIQDRVGLRSQTFRIIKFRSMRVDAELSGAKWAEKGDSRITRVGRVIRKLRIDELPQFINIIRGDMSLIGPRPERPVFVKQLELDIPYYSQRHWVRPGLTGWAQVRYPYGASAVDAVEKLQYDLYYIKNRSLVLDTIVLFETVRVILSRRLAR